MAGVVNRRIVEQDEILIRSPAANVKTTVAFTCRLNPGQHLNGFQDIDFTHQCWEALDGGHGHFGFAQVCAFRILTSASNNLSRTYGDGLRRHGHIPFNVGISLHRGCNRGIANESALQFGWTTRQGEAEKTVDVGGYTFGLSDIHDVGSKNVFPGVDICDAPTDCEGLSPSMRHGQEARDKHPCLMKTDLKLWMRCHGQMRGANVPHVTWP